MARPKIENGYARIANELLMALSRPNLSAYETRALFFVLRKTYGWGKKNDRISISQIADGTGLLKPHACRAKRALIKKNILTEIDGKLGLNKDYEAWKITDLGNVTNIGNESAIKAHKQRSVTDLGNDASVTDLGNSVTDLGNKSLPIQAPQKKRKKLLQKKRSSCVSDKGKKASDKGESFDRFWAIYPRKVGKQNCRHIWNRLKPSAELVEQIVTAVQAYKRTEQWQGANGKYIPHPSTWLNQARWEDEISTKPEPQKGDPDWLPTEAEVDELFRQTGIKP